MRIVERINADSSDWESCRMMDLREGDTFRMYEETGEPVLGIEFDNESWVVVSPPFINDDGVAEVMADPVKDKKI